MCACACMWLKPFVSHSRKAFFCAMKLTLSVSAPMYAHTPTPNSHKTKRLV